MVHSGPQERPSIPTELLSRLAVASEGSRELDRDLAKLIDRAEWEKCANWASQPCGAQPETIDRDALRWLPAYTASLDAALALAERVLPGWFISLERYSDGWYATTCDHSTSQRRFQGSQKPAALALCIAILKAAEAA